MNYPTPLNEIPWPISKNINETICPLCRTTFSRIKSMSWIGNQLHTEHADCPNCGPITREPKWDFYYKFYDTWLETHKNDYSDRHRLRGDISG